MGNRLRLRLCVATSTAVLVFSAYQGIASSLAASPGSTAASQHSRSAQDGATTPASWRVLHSPNSALALNGLFATSAVSSGDVWAVGAANNVDGTMGSTLIEHWNGARWTIVPSPNPSGSATSILTGVAAISGGDVWAVGSSTDTNNVTRTLTEHWDGVKWTVVPSPNLSATTNEFLGLAAVSNSRVWAVGDYVTGNKNHALIAQWNGARWIVVNSPTPPGTASTFLLGVTAVFGGDDVWAAGYSTTSTSAGKTLTEHWNGTEWQVVPSPDPGPNGNFLSGVSAASDGVVWAVGDAAYPPGPHQTFNHQTLVERWNGSTWGVVKSPPLEGTGLSGVVAVSANDVWAVGSSAAGIHGPTFTLIEHWDGKSWRRVASPNPAFDNTLLGVAAVSAGNVWAVGALDHNTTLVEHYS